MNISFEMFPPKKEGNFESAFEIANQLSDLHPEFVSVTYGAGGSKSKKTLEIASHIQNDLSTEAVAHLTCVGSTKREIQERCSEFEKNHISHILALRGDRPKDMTDEQYNSREFFYATDLIKYIKENTELHVFAACYPEKHFEAKSLVEDMTFMKEKQDLGVEAFISQMFFDNRYFLEFVEKAGVKGIKAPVHAGIMPITNAKQLGTTITLSGSSVPKELTDLIARYGENPDDMYKAGLDYAVRQVIGLKENGVCGAHIYTMNKPEIARQIVQALK